MNVKPTAPPLKVLHVSLFRKAGLGHLAQLSFEVDAASGLKTHENCDWKTVCWVSVQNENSDNNFVRQVPRLFRHPRIAPLYVWVKILGESKKNDFVLFRYPMPDLFSWIFAPLVPNLVTVHHTKEEDELRTLPSGFRRNVATYIETKLQPRAFRKLRGIIGVTKEISEYELRRFPATPYVSTMPNGTSVSEKPIIDNRASKLEVAFVASHFYSWHGLDLLLDSLDSYLEMNENDIELTIHLVGALNEAQLTHAAALADRGADIVLHGSLDPEKVKRILSKCHIALGSFALSRKGLTEASTLKVRDYLAAGLPVYSGHVDSGLPQEFPFYMHAKTISIAELINFAEDMRKVQRDEVIRASIPYINKVDILTKQVELLRTWK